MRYSLRILTVLLLSFSAKAVKAQGNSADSISIKCDGGKIFTKCEVPPALKHDAVAYQTLLTNHLKEKDQLPRSGEATIYATISKTGQLIDATIRMNSIKKIESIIDAMRSIPDQWLPGKQNGHVICAFVQIDLEVANKNIYVKVGR